MLQDDKKHYLALDSLRGICATLVVFYHFEGVTYIGSIPFVRNAFLFVDFFFVLSGFVIASSYAERIAAGFPVGKFMFLRLGRLYPLYAAVLLAYLGIAAAKQFADPGYNASDFIVSALLLQVWTNYVPQEMNHWNPPSWSISAEFWTYLLFAVTLSTFRKRAWPLFAAMILVSLLFLITMSDRYVAVCFSGGGLFRCIFGFSFGVLTYLGYRYRLPVRKKKDNAVAASLIEVAGVTVCLALVSVAGAGPWSLACPAFFSILLLIFAAEEGVVSHMLLSAPMRLIGVLSYSIYMVHEFILARFVNLVAALNRYVTLPVAPDPLHPFALASTSPTYVTDIAAIVAYALVVAVSYLTYTYVEAPCRKRSRRFARSR